MGPTGSGKSTLAGRAGEVLGIEPVHLDDVYHLPGWKALSPEEFHRRTEEITSRPRWILDGNYGALRRLHMHKAQLIVWLDPPGLVTWLRLIRRSLRRIVLKERCCNGNVETWGRTFFSRESVFLWAKSDRRRLATLEKEVAERSLPCVKLRCRRDVERWLASLASGTNSTP